MYRLAELLSSRVKNFQIQYQVLYCFWLLTYNDDVATQIGQSATIIPILVETLKSIAKEKVIRMCLATLRVFIYLFHYFTLITLI